MDIDPKIAQNIVANLKDVLRHDINFFDTSGTIIASTDRCRIGSWHEAAKLAVRLDKPIIVDQDHQYAGARDGINVPVVFNEAVVAVIGITGEGSDVEPLGKVIKKMTEILIRENLDQITRFDQRMLTDNLVNLLTLERKDMGLAGSMAAALGIELGRGRAIVGRTCGGAPGVVSAPEGLYDGLAEVCQAYGVSLFSAGPREFRVFVGSGESAGDGGILPSLFTDLRSRLGAVVGDGLVLGLGLVETSADRYWRSYRQAARAADWFVFTGQRGVCPYERMDEGLVVSSLPEREARRFVARVLGGIDEERLDAFEEVLRAYRRRNGSITRAAKDLYIHKNTMQNRLNTIARATGYNPRKLSDYPLLDLAFRLRAHLRFCEHPSAS
ncbi:CdaR family transcriptional regulator [Bifidobacterium xylocopae]|uniref:Sugar diacid recognition n=1 Tax=Bifidobacterium xylocopae TaxID=2493119 RepID=A0A366KD15_9BIFI|nr:sugar diacid recognition domain-containing protein [Bifidobacterium xylocopae]RBP99068.1 hypothetical protein CRD59_05835 [Bifidobacterium xylocopae]